MQCHSRLDRLVLLVNKQAAIRGLLKNCKNSISYAAVQNRKPDSFLKANPSLLHNLNRNYYVSVRNEQAKNAKEPESAFDSLIESSQQSSVSTHVTGAKRAKQAAKDFSYLSIIAVGGVMLTAIGYYLFTALFSRETPEGIYNESSKICLNHPDVQEALGAPIKVTTESGGRRVFQIRHKFAIENARLTLTMNYFLEGPQNKGTVVCKVFKNESTGKFEYEYIIVKLEYIHRGERRIVVRQEEPTETTRLF